MAKFIRFLGPDGPTYGRVEDDVVYTCLLYTSRCV